MSVDDFKAIYWWEWGHRLLGRLVGVGFLLPFLWFLWRGFIDRGLASALGGIFALGALQGAIGWWMVASGLTERLSPHFSHHLSIFDLMPEAQAFWWPPRSMLLV